jgi:PPOX class probable F420-dependent enzyme
MPDHLEGRPRELFETANHAVVAVPRRDGTVQTVVAWVHPEGDTLTLNSAEGRAWPANLRSAKTATVTVMDGANPMEWASVTGRLVACTPDGADEHIDSLAKKYLDQDEYPYRAPGEQRLKIVLAPERVSYMNAAG